MAGLLDEGGIWERNFILPEHKRAMERQSQEAKRRTKPILDVQELEQIHLVLSESFYEHRRISLRLFDEFEDSEISGIVTAVQTHRREIKLAIAPGDWKWIQIENIISIL